jgi:hypothetical protein
MSADQRKQRTRRLQRKLKRKIPGYTAEAELAEQLDVGLRTLRKWRQVGQGPAYTHIGRRVFYPEESCTAWIKSRIVHPARTEAAVV